MLKSEDFRTLAGPQKAAIFMMALGEEQCTRLFAMMHEDEIKDISAAMSQLGAVRSEVVERLCLAEARDAGVPELDDHDVLAVPCTARDDERLGQLERHDPRGNVHGRNVPTPATR